MTMNSNAMKHVTLQTLPVFLFKKIQQLIKVYIAKRMLGGISGKFSQQSLYYPNASKGRALVHILNSVLCEKPCGAANQLWFCNSKAYMVTLGQLSCYLKYVAIKAVYTGLTVKHVFHI